MFRGNILSSFKKSYNGDDGDDGDDSDGEDRYDPKDFHQKQKK